MQQRSAGASPESEDQKLSEHLMMFEESGHDAIAVVDKETAEAPRESSLLMFGRRSSQRRALDVGDDMVLEYIAFRGFTETFRSFSMERLDDARRRGSFDARFAVEALLRPVRELDWTALVEAWEFVESKFLVHLDAELAAHASTLRCSLFRYFCVAAVVRREPSKAIDLLADLSRRDADDARGRKRAVSLMMIKRRPEDEDERALWALSENEDDEPDEDDGRRGDDDDPRDLYRARNGDSWREWFAMPHLSEPHRDPVFRLYFTRRWQDDFKLSLRNFLATVFARAPPPKLLLLEKWHRSSAQKALRSALADSKKENQALHAALLRASQSRDALATTVKTLIAHCHHESLRDSSRLHRGGLFDEDPADAHRLARDAGATALELAKRCDTAAAPIKAPAAAAAAAAAGPPSSSSSSDENPTVSRDAMLLSLCEATKTYLDLLRGVPAISDASP